MTFIRQINLFNKILLLFFKIMICFTFVSDHNTDSLMNVVFCSVKERVQLSE